MSYPGHSLGGGLTPLQRCSQCILQPQPTGQDKFVISFLNELELICLHSSIAIVSLQLDGLNYYYLTVIILLFNTIHSFAHRLVGWLVGCLGFMAYQPL